MQILPPPDRGQPIDVPYIYRMVTAINAVSDQVNDSSEKYTTIYNRESASQQNIRTSDTKFYASFLDIAQKVNVSAGDTKDFSFNFTGFKYAPIAVVTPINTGTSTASNDVLVVITSTTTSRVEGFVRFSSAGVVDVAVNIIAIGIPE